MKALAELLNSISLEVVFRAGYGIADAVGKFLAPVLLIVSMYIRLMETQLNALTGSGKYGTALRDQLRLEYNLRIVGRSGVQSGFWTFPEINTEATNYYVVVEAIDPEGKALSLPILNEENQETETVPMWGVRVPESVYRSVEADKRDDGIIQRNIVGIKQYGFLAVDYTLPVLGGTVTRW